MQPHKEHHRSLVDLDPEERGEFAEDALSVEARPSEDAEPSEDTTEREGPELDTDDTGDLYGVHVSPAGDSDLSAPEDHDSFADADLGENWIEVLEQHSAEGGPAPEHEVTVIDDSDPHDDHPPTDFRDRPKADRGSGGPGGL